MTAVPHLHPVALPGVRFGRIGRSAVLAVSSFGAFLAFLDATIVNVAFTDIAASFPDASLGSLSWVLNAYNIVFAAFLIAAGRLADLLGRRRTFRLGVAVFTVASVACAVSGSVAFLVVMRAVQAFGAALLVPASIALVVEAFPPERRAHAVGLWGAAAALAGGLGPPIGGVLVDAGGWRLTFLVNLPLGLAAWLSGRRMLVESRAPGVRSMPDLLGATFVAGGLGLLTLAIVQGGDWGWTALPTLLSVVAAGALLAAFGATSRRHPSPVLDPTLIRLPTFAWANALTVLAGAGFYAYLLTHILWLTMVWQYSVVQAGLAVMPGAVIAAATTGALGRVVDRYGARVVLIPGAAVWAGAFGWYLLTVGTSPHFLTEWLPGQVLSGIGVGCTLPVLGSAAMAAVPGGRFAAASAVVSSARQLGGALGIAVLVVIIGTPRGPGAVDALRHGWLLTACCFLAVAVLGWQLKPSAATDDDLAADDDVAYPAEPVATSVPAPRQAVEAPVGARSAPADLLRSVPLFAGLPAADLDALRRAGRTVNVAAGEWLFRQGDNADALYVVRSGFLEVHRDGHVVGTLSRGDVLGELGLLTRSPRAAGVRARRDSELLRISRRRFDDTLGSDSRAMRVLARTLATQVQTAVPVPRGHGRARTVAVFASGPLLPVEFVTEMIQRALADVVSTVVLDRCDGAALELAEQTHEVVLLPVAAADPGEWADFALRQADRVLVVAGADADPVSVGTVGGIVDVWLLGDPPSAERIVAWHDRFAPRTCEPIPVTLDAIGAAAKRFADRLAGRSIGVVLSGGGARAVAHVGVLDELRAAGLRIDRIAGCSMGGFIGALVACGLTPDEIEDRIYAEFVRHNPAGDYTLPRVALARGARGRAMLDRTFGDTLIEQLPLPYYTVASDLHRHELVVFRRGPVGVAVGASVALPGILPPQVVGDRVLVDGGVLDNLPVRPMAELGEGPLIAVNVVGGSDHRRSDGPRVPGLQETLMRAMTMSSAATAEATRASIDLLITPRHDGVGLLEFHQYERMREAGRAAAREALAAIGGPAGLAAAAAPTVTEQSAVRRRRTVAG
jgi:NTE family protein